MYIGQAQSTYITGFYRQTVIDEANKYCKDNEGWMIWRDIYSTKKWLGWFKWKTEYRIDLYKPIDYEIRRL